MPPWAKTYKYLGTHLTYCLVGASTINDNVFCRERYRIRCELHAGQSFSLQRMEELIPNWLGVQWSQLEPLSDLQEGEWMATYQNWRVNLYADPSSGLDHREVMLRYVQVCS